MLRKTVIGLAAAGLIAAGSLGATTSSASAGVYFGPPGIWLGWGPGPWWGPYPYWGHPHRVCGPVYKTVKWKDKKGHWHKSRKVVGHRCWWERW